MAECRPADSRRNRPSAGRGEIRTAPPLVNSRRLGPNPRRRGGARPSRRAVGAKAPWRMQGDATARGKPRRRVGQGSAGRGRETRGVQDARTGDANLAAGPQDLRQPAAAWPACGWPTGRPGIKYRDRTDVLMMVLAPGTQVAGVFTQSKTASAPVEWCRKQLAGGTARVLVVNSGNANAFTGKAGHDGVRRGGRIGGAASSAAGRRKCSSPRPA